MKNKLKIIAARLLQKMGIIPPIVFVGVISHKHGENVYVGWDCATVWQEIQSYVLDEWENEIGGQCPEDADAAVEQYFEKMRDATHSESYHIDSYCVS